MLGKRPRPPMKRTTSMTEFAFDLNTSSDPQQQQQQPPSDPHNPFNQNYKGLDQRFSPRSNHRPNSADFIETAHFLRACGLCKRRLTPGRDIYMYRGDTAFCSLECRQQQMTHDERKEKCSLASKKESAASSAVSLKSPPKARQSPVPFKQNLDGFVVHNLRTIKRGKKDWE